MASTPFLKSSVKGSSLRKTLRRVGKPGLTNGTSAAGNPDLPRVSKLAVELRCFYSQCHPSSKDLNSTHLGLDRLHRASHRVLLVVAHKTNKSSVGTLETKVETIVSAMRRSNRGMLQTQQDASPSQADTYGFKAAGYTSGGMRSPVSGSFSNV